MPSDRDVTSEEVNHAMNPLLFQTGFKDLTPEQRHVTEEAHKQFADQPWLTAPFAIWQHLAEEVSTNPAVLFSLLETLVYEWPRPHREKGRDFYAPLIAETIEKLTHILEKEPQRAEYLILQGTIYFWQWQMAHFIEGEETGHTKTTPFESDVLLLQAISYYKKAMKHLGTDAEIVASFGLAVCARIKSISHFHATDALRQATEEMGRILEKLIPELPDDFTQLNALADALHIIARRCFDKKIARGFRFRSLDAFRKIAAMEGVPPKIMAGLTIDMQAQAILDYAALLVLDIVCLETEDALKQSYLDESLAAIQLYAEKTPDFPDSEDGYGVAIHFICMAQETPFPEKRGPYLDMAQARVERDMKLSPDMQWKWNVTMECIEEARTIFGLASGANGE